MAPPKTHIHFFMVKGPAGPKSVRSLGGRGIGRLAVAGGSSMDSGTKADLIGSLGGVFILGVGAGVGADVGVGAGIGVGAGVDAGAGEINGKSGGGAAVLIG